MNISSSILLSSRHDKMGTGTGNRHCCVLEIIFEQNSSTWWMLLFLRWSRIRIKIVLNYQTHCSAAEAQVTDSTATIRLVCSVHSQNCYSDWFRSSQCAICRTALFIDKALHIWEFWRVRGKPKWCVQSLLFAICYLLFAICWLPEIDSRHLDNFMAPIIFLWLY